MSNRKMYVQFWSGPMEVICKEQIHKSSLWAIPKVLPRPAETLKSALHLQQRAF